jgi:Zn-finger nucleic acid-binding protein
MEKVVFDGTEVDRCTSCKGLWFDASEKEKLREIQGSEAVDTGGAEVSKAYNDVDRIECPVCLMPMTRMVIPQERPVWFESCPGCQGAFFDAGEFRDYKEDSFVDFLKDLVRRERT